MTEPRPWIVMPHDPIEKIEDNLWAVDGDVPGVAGLRRRMTIIRLTDGRLVFHNAVPVDDAAAREIEAWGQPAFLVVPHAHHKRDAHAFQKRFGLTVLCPAVARDVVSSVVAVDADLGALPQDSHLRSEPLDGVNLGEHVLVVTSADGTRASLVFCDAIANIPHGPGMRGLLYRVFGFTGTEPKVMSMFRRRFVADPRALRRHFERLAALPNLARLIPSHGGIAAGDAAGALRRAAARM